MQKTKIEWTDYVWNIQTGCKNGCEYCYARKMANRLKGRVGYDVVRPFDPKFHPDRLNEIGGLPKSTNSKNHQLPRGTLMVFTASMGEFGWAKPTDFKTTIDKIRESKHIFQILTKIPQQLTHNLPADLPRNLWLGVSINQQSDAWRVEKLTDYIDNPKYGNRWLPFLSIEPLHGEIDLSKVKGIEKIRWVIIGAETGNRKGKIIPKREWIAKIREFCAENDIPLFIKDNANPDGLNEDLVVHQFPVA